MSNARNHSGGMFLGHTLDHCGFNAIKGIPRNGCVSSYPIAHTSNSINKTVKN